MYTYSFNHIRNRILKEITVHFYQNIIISDFLNILPIIRENMGRTDYIEAHDIMYILDYNICLIYIWRAFWHWACLKKCVKMPVCNAITMQTIIFLATNLLLRWRNTSTLCVETEHALLCGNFKISGERQQQNRGREQHFLLKKSNNAYFFASRLQYF
jgi:hypothetical protein